MSRSEGVSVMRSRSVLDQAWELFHVLAPNYGYYATPEVDAAVFGALAQSAFAFDLDVAELVTDLDRHAVELDASVDPSEAEVLYPDPRNQLAALRRHLAIT